MEQGGDAAVADACFLDELESVREAAREWERGRGWYPACDRWCTGLNYSKAYEDDRVVMLVSDCYAAVHPSVLSYEAVAIVVSMAGDCRAQFG